MGIAREQHVIQEQHENAVLIEFSRYIESKGFKVDLLPRPKEPHLGDGLLTINGGTWWIEIVDVFEKEREAKELWDHVTPGRTSDPKRLRVEDSIIPRQFPQQLLYSIEKKLKNPGYIDAFKKWGSGILLGVCQDPLVDFDDDLDRIFIDDEINTNQEKICALNKEKIFRDIYLYALRGKKRNFNLLFSF